MAEDLYKTLGVERSATADEIRSAYKKLARKHHPDVNPGDAKAEQRFKEVSAAYEVLSDADKRKNYDEFGEESLQSGFDPERARSYRQWSQARQAGGRPFEAESFDFDLDDLLGSFGGRAARGSPFEAVPRRGADLRAVIELDFEQAIRGSEIEIQVPVSETCSTCSGSGEKPGTGSTCSVCGGSGHRQVARGPMRMSVTCENCGGGGRIAEPCTTCGGRGHVERNEPLKFRIPAGADDGSVLRIDGKGAPGARGGPRGDLVIETRVRPHPLFERDGLDLSLKLPVRIDEVYLGAEVEVPTFDGPIKLRIPPHSRPGSRLRARGKGVKRGGKHGDLYVELDMRWPDGDDPALSEAIQRAKDAYEPIRKGIKL
jgi:molecular chaperone DnaJ